MNVITLCIVVFTAALLQASTGVGYGVVAGPIMLIALNGTDALQISIVHNLLIACLLAPSLIKICDRRLLKSLVIGSAIGLPMGFALLSVAGITTLKIMAAIAVSFTLYVTCVNIRNESSSLPIALAGSKQAKIVGSLAGSMGGALAMPGPLAAAWMSVRGWSKESIRATILVYFLFAYGFALVMQLSFSEIHPDTWKLTMWLGIPVALGIFTGNWLSASISEHWFKTILRAVLAATVIALLFSL